jgi:sRNA-binding carbon storage regulator CsrA
VQIEALITIRIISIQNDVILIGVSSSKSAEITDAEGGDPFRQSRQPDIQSRMQSCFFHDRPPLLALLCHKQNMKAGK